MLAAQDRLSDLGRPSTAAGLCPDPAVWYVDSFGAVSDLGAERHRRDRCSDPVASGSVRHPLVDDLTVRQTGTIADALSGVVNQRIEAGQQQVFADVRKRSTEELNALETLEVTTDADADGVG